MSDSTGMDLYSAVAAAAAGVAGILRRDAISAVLFWGEHPEAEVVHRHGVADEVCRALTTAGGRLIAAEVRRAGSPLRIRASSLPDDARELRSALIADDIESLAVMPLFGERGVVGCMIVPLHPGEDIVDPLDNGWRIACRSLVGLQLAAATAALRAALLHERRSPAQLYDGVLVLDRWERVTLADGLFRAFPGWNREDPFGRPLDSLPGMSALAGIPATGDGTSWEEHLLPPILGHGIPVTMMALPLGPEDGLAPGGRVVFLRDLRPDASTVSDGTSRMLGLAMRVAHAGDEIARVLEMEGSSAQNCLDPELLAALHHEVSEAGELVGQVLDRCLSHDERSRVDLNEVLGEVVERYRPELEQEGVSIFSFLKPELPRVPGDRIELLRVFRRLVLEARESLQPAGGSMTVRTWSEDNWVYGAVSDDGSGRPRNDPEQLSEPLFDLAGGPEDDGLALVRAIVDGHGGRLTVESRPSVWTRVTVMLCQERRRSVRPDQNAAIRTHARHESDGSGLAVLVVDDNAALRSVLRRYLERRGHSVTEAVDGEDALRILMARDFDRVIVDIQMPVKNGPEFYEGLRVVAPSMRERTIFMTGGFLESNTERFISESGRPAISKPFDLAEMARTVES